MGLVDLMSISFPRFGRFPASIALSIVSLPFSISPPSRIPIIQILCVTIISCKSYRLSSLLFIFFFLSSDCIFSNVRYSRSVILSSVCLSVLLKLSIELLSSVIVLLSSKISFFAWGFNGFYFFVAISIFSYLSILSSCSFVNLFKRTILVL